MNIREQMERIYSDVPLDEIPWNRAEPPEILVHAVESGKIEPCKVVDLGCGAGNHSVWLAERGFDVTGIDISAKAIEHASRLASSKGVSCRFVAVDLLGDLEEYHESFNLALDWEVLHHIFPDDRTRYVKNVHNLLHSEGRYLSLCFSERDPSFGGEGKFRKTPLGTTLYFSSEDELAELFASVFEVISIETVEIRGKRGIHMANLSWLMRH